MSDEKTRKDLGTYWLRVEFSDGRGFLQEWNTGARYMRQTDDFCPLGAERIPSHYTDEQDLLDRMEFMYTKGNYACDCNRLAFIAVAQREEPPEDIPCAHTLKLSRLTAIRPDGSEVELEVSR